MTIKEIIPTTRWFELTCSDREVTVLRQALFNFAGTRDITADEIQALYSALYIAQDAKKT